MTVFPKLIYRFGAFTIKIPASFFADIEKLIQKFLWKLKGCGMTKIILKQQQQ